MRVNTFREGTSHLDSPAAARRTRSEGERLWRYRCRRYPTAKDFRVPVSAVLEKARREAGSVDINTAILGGTPRIKNTRIPVYMILDAIDFYGNLEDVRKSYPDLTIENIKDAVRFARSVVEFRVDNETSNSS